MTNEEVKEIPKQTKLVDEYLRLLEENKKLKDDMIRTIKSFGDANILIDLEINVIKGFVAEKIVRLEGGIDDGGLKGVRENTEAELSAWREIKQMIDNVTE